MYFCLVQWNCTPVQLHCRPTFPQFTNHAILPLPHQKCYGTLSEIHQWHFVHELYQTCWAWYYVCSFVTMIILWMQIIDLPHTLQQLFSILAAVICKTKSIALLKHLTTSRHPADVILVHSVAITVMIHCCVYKISFSVVFRLYYIIVLLLCRVFTAVLIENIGCQCQCQ